MVRPPQIWDRVWPLPKVMVTVQLAVPVVAVLAIRTSPWKPPLPVPHWPVLTNVAEQPPVPIGGGEVAGDVVVGGPDVVVVGGGDVGVLDVGVLVGGGDVGVLGEPLGRRTRMPRPLVPRYTRP